MRSRTICRRVVEPRGQLAPLDFGVDDALADDAAHEIGPHDAQWRAVGPLREPQHRGAHRLELEGIGGDPRAVPERELAELLGAVGVDHREVDPAADAHRACRRHGRRVEVVVLVAHRAVTEELHVPVRGLREDRALLGLEVGADAGEVADLRATKLGVRLPGRGQERVPEPGPVHRVGGGLVAREASSRAVARTWCRPAGEGTE